MTMLEKLRKKAPRSTRPGVKQGYPPPGQPTSARNAFESTRSSKSADGHRDMDGFDPDEELLRFRLALKNKAWERAAQLAANLDENMQRGGPIPVAWLGPKCMRSAEDRTYQLDEALEREKAIGDRNDFV